ncbi:MAG: PHP domain-containing protein [Promethearchaeota archaeon]
MKNKLTKFDLHMHSPFSDGQINLDLQIRTAIKLGLKIIGFADHIFPFAIYKHPKDGSIQPSGLVNCFSADFLKYRKEVLRYYDKKYPQIRILNGGEIDIYPHGTLTLPKGIKPSFFDYLLVAKHHTLPKDFGFLFRKYPKLEKWLWMHDPYLKMNEYLWEKGLYAAFMRYKPDIFAHFQEGMPKSIGYLRNKEKMKRFVLMCKKYNVAIELNNLFWDKKRQINHIKWCYPILEYGHEYGVEFSIASDFHGFEKDIEKYLNKSQEMLELVEKYDLKLIDPTRFLPENSCNRKRS